SIEDSGVFNAGRGAVPNTAGHVETDAAVMSDHRAGAVCAVTWPANPVRAALAVAEAADALLLAGSGADDFARAAGLSRRDPATLTRGGTMPLSEMGTVGAVAVDATSHLAAATSTGGRASQPPGRVGDSPIIGAGTWAVSDGVAVSATGDGEQFVRAGFAHRIDAAVRGGVHLAEAAAGALAAVEHWHGTGGAIVLGPGGELVIIHDTPAMAWGRRSSGGAFAEVIVENG
ncbi:MAG: isoaspartyl peptidase/L-asparaginase, partial [Actinomycetes bacterium]